MKTKFFALLNILIIGFFHVSNSQTCIEAQYLFNGNANDNSGNNYHGIAYGPILTFGITAQDSAYYFDGFDDYIELNNNEPVVNSEEFTISVWAKMTDVGGGLNNQNVLFSQRDENSSLDAQSLIVFLAEDQNNMIKFMLRSSTAVNAERIDLIYPSLLYNEWHYYVALLDETKTMRLYLDGIQVASALFPQSGNFISSVDHVYIGTTVISGSSRGFFNGILSELTIYDCALTEDEILQIYENTLTIDEPNNDYSVKLYPNPIVEKATLEIIGINESFELLITDLTGKTVKHLFYKNKNVEVSINCRDFKKGMYLYKILSKSGLKFSGKIIIL